MGLYISPHCFMGSYSSFSIFRTKIAELAGYPAILKTNNQDIPEETREQHLYGIWKKEPKDVIFTLLEHLDNEGEIPNKFALPLAQRLEELLHRSTDKDVRNQIQNFIDGLKSANSTGENIQFS